MGRWGMEHRWEKLPALRSESKYYTLNKIFLNSSLLRCSTSSVIRITLMGTFMSIFTVQFKAALVCKWTALNVIIMTYNYLWHTEVLLSSVNIKKKNQTAGGYLSMRIKVLTTCLTIDNYHCKGVIPHMQCRSGTVVVWQWLSSDSGDGKKRSW